MNRLLKKIVFIFILFFIPSVVFAVSIGYTPGTESGDSGDCKSGFLWCYHDKSHIGFRLTLYQYDGTDFMKLGNSIDYQPLLSNLKNGSAIIPTNSNGKVYYTTTNTTPIWPSASNPSTRATSLNFIQSSLVPTFYNKELVDAELVFYSFVTTQFSLLSGNASTIRSKIKNVFGSSIPDDLNLRNIYITVEPTILFYNRTSGGRVSYYGTAYEVTYLRGVTDRRGICGSTSSGKSRDHCDFYGMVGEIFYNLPRTLMARTIVGTDPNGFVGSRDSNLVKKLGLLGDFDRDHSFINDNSPIMINVGDDGYTKRTENQNRIQSNEGFGIKVYWIGAYAPSCSDSCSRTRANTQDRLKCAEAWCASNDNSNKKSCIDSCGYTEPTTVCPGVTCENATTTTTCADSRSATSETCDTYGRYIMFECKGDGNTEEVTFSNDLPTTLLSGLGGFNYSVSKTTNKNCKITFNTNLAEYDYAILNNDTQRNTFKNNLATTLTNYNKIKTNNNYAQYWDAKSDTSNLNITFKVNGDSTTYKTDYSNVRNNSFIKNHKTPSDVYGISQDDSKTITLYKNGSQSTATSSTGVSNIYRYTINTTSEDVYQLAPRCYTLLDGRVNKVSSLGLPACKDLKYRDTDLYGYFGYYSNVTTTSNRATQVDTTTSVGGKCIRSANNCQYYVVDESFECNTKVTKVLNKYEVTFEVDGYKTGGTVITYSFDGPQATYLGRVSKEYSPHAHNYVTKTAYIKYNVSTSTGNKTVTKTCNFVIPPEDEDTDYNTCKEIYSGDSCEKINEIQQYCQKNWFTDKTGYQSENDCVKDCSCSSTTTPTKGYTYRPISLGNGSSWSDANGDGPFPRGRDPGYNWKGEDHDFDIIKSDEETFGGEPLYVIRLDAEAIRKIRQSNKSNPASYLNYKNSTNTNTFEADRSKGYLFYRSKFIKNNSQIFTRRG